MNPETKRCTKCLQSQPIENYYLKLGKPRTRCKKCLSKETVENPKHKLHSKKYYENNREYCIKQIRAIQAKPKMEKSLENSQSPKL